MSNHIYSERADLFEPNIYIQFFVKIIGNPSSDALLAAVKKAFEANEATMSKVVIDNNGNAFYEKMAESGCKVFVIRSDWKDIIRQNEKIPFAIDKGELIRVFVLTSKDDTHILVMAHHLVGDGKSIAYFIEDVMMALSGKNLSYKPLQLITKDSLPAKSKLSFVLKMYINSFNRKWKHTGRVFNWDNYYKLHKTYWNERSSEIIYEHFSAEEINRIHTHSKEIGVSVNSYIIAAFLEANRNNGMAGIPVNIRPLGNKAMVNQTTGISVDYRFSDNITFDENVQIIHKKVINKVAKPFIKYFVLQFMTALTPTLVDSVLLHTYGLYQNKTTQKLAKVIGYTGGKTIELGVTNLTKIDIPNAYGKYRIENALFIPPVVSYAKHIIGVLTMEDGMYISYHFMNFQNTEKEKEIEFFNRAIKTLKII